MELIQSNHKPVQDNIVDSSRYIVMNLHSIRQSTDFSLKILPYIFILQQSVPLYFENIPVKVIL
jgi:hypothetical protein